MSFTLIAPSRTTETIMETTESTAPPEGGEVATTASNIELISAAEINQQIATAKKDPRSVAKFLRDARALVTLNESVAQQCIYALMRDGKTIEGPSARFAEIIVHAWGNSRVGARVVSEGAEFITAQGVMHDLERNVAITFEVQRRIVGSKGKRYGVDMIGVTANAACSIALRNAILKVVPKAFWEAIYQEARKIVAGDVQTLANKRAAAIQQFAVYGISKEQIFARLGRAGISDINIDDLVTLFGILTAIKDGDTTPEDAFAVDSSQMKAPQSKSASAPPPAEPAPADSSPPAAAQADEPPSADKQKPKPKLATPGENAKILKRLDALSISFGEACYQLGLPSDPPMTADEYIALSDFAADKEKRVP
jgi:hypothetical protein